MEDVFFLRVEEAYRETLWCKRCLAGIMGEAKRKRISVIEDSSEDGITVVLGTDPEWVAAALPHRARCILISFPLFRNVPNISHISMDYADASRRLIAHLCALSKERIAMFGINPASAPDRLKLEGFVNYRKKCGVREPERDVFYNNGSVEEVCRAFLERAAGYDAVICANDIMYSALIRRLREQGISLQMATFGEKERPGAGVVTAHLDFEEVGRQAVRAFRMLRGNPSLSSVSAMLACNISNGAAEVLLEDTRPSIEELNLPQVDFYGDIEAGGILRMERFFDECDDIDRCIIIRLVQHMTYSDIAEELFISEGTVSYRVKKLQALTRTASREDLVEFLKRYREE